MQNRHWARLVEKNKKTLLYIIVLFISPSLTADIQWHWQDKFTQAEQVKLKTWVQLTHQTIETSIAPFPFDIHIHFHRNNHADEPVPWANTQRQRTRQGIDFYVDPSYSKNDFIEDWTGAHELSHLLLPYLGKQHAWFAEGFASYMQYYVHEQLALISKHERDKKYHRRFNREQRRYPYPQLSFIDAAKQLQDERNYPAMYWASAVYFYNIDQYLQTKNSSFVEIIRKYVTCCRMKTSTLHELLQTFDTLSETTIFTDEIEVFKNQRGFPTIQKYR